MYIYKKLFEYKIGCANIVSNVSILCCLHLNLSPSESHSVFPSFRLRLTPSESHSVSASLRLHPLFIKIWDEFWLSACIILITHFLVKSVIFLLLLCRHQLFLKWYNPLHFEINTGFQFENITFNIVNLRIVNNFEHFVALNLLV